MKPILTFFILITIWSCNLFSQSVPEGFEIIKVLDLCCHDVGFEILPDGRIIVINKFGEIKLFVNGELRKRFVAGIISDVFSNTESGVTGIAIDPDYPSEPYLYLFYSHVDSTNRVSRFTFKGDLVDPNSDNLIAENEFVLRALPLKNDTHNGGTLRFAKDKTLYISYGDDHRPELVQNLSAYNGKILRINRDGTIPPDNPTFPDEPVDKKPEIFAIGLRNPFRFSLNLNDELFIGDVGAGAKEELDISNGGENYGWPRYEGANDMDSLAMLIEPAPLFPVFEYGHIPQGQWAVVALLSYNRVGNNSFPAEFNNTYFYADFYHDWINYLRFDGNKWVSKEFGTGFVLPVDAMLGQDGSIYVMEYGVALNRIVYMGMPSLVGRNEIPKSFILSQNYPNPFNPSTNIKYSLLTPSIVILKVYDLLGGEVNVLVNEFKASGEYQVEFDASSLGSGIYFYGLFIDNIRVDIKKAVYVK